MKKFGLSLFFIFSLIVSLNAKVGVVNVKRVFNEFKGFSQVEEDLQKDISSWRQKADEMRQYAEDMRKEVENRRNVLSEEAYNREMEKVRKEEEKYKAFVDSIWGENGRLQKRYEELIKPMVDVMYKIIQDIAANEGYDIILDSSQEGVVYSSQENDITDMVIEGLNYEYGIIEKKTKIVVYDFYGEGDIVKEQLLDVKLCDSLRTRLEKFDQIEITDPKTMRVMLQKDGIMPGESLSVDKGGEYADKLETDYFILGTVKSSGETVTMHVQVYATKTQTQLLDYEDSVSDLTTISLLIDRVTEKVYESIK